MKLTDDTSFGALRAALSPQRAVIASLVLLLYGAAAIGAETPVVGWLQRYNGPGNNTDNAQAIAVDSKNNVIVAGSSYGGPSGFDYAVVCYSGAGAGVWTNRYSSPGPGGDALIGAVVDSGDNVIVTGHSAAGTNFHFTTIKYSASGVPVWTNHYTGQTFVDARACALATDRAGSVIVAGEFARDYVIILYSSAGEPLWTNRYNGPANGPDVPVAVATDSANNILVTGRSAGGGVGSDFLTIKYSNAGLPLWTNRYNAPANSIDEPAAMVIDTEDNVIVTGRSVGTYYGFGTIKYSSQGAVLWTNYYREANGTTAYPAAMALDRNNNVFITGYYYAGLYENFATVGYSSAGAPLWTNLYDRPGNSTDVGRAVTVDDNGCVIVTGYAAGDYATIKYSNSGLPLWTNLYNGAGNGGDSPWAIALDRTGDFVVTGQSDSGPGGFDFATMKFVSPPQVAGVRSVDQLFELHLRRPNQVVIEASTNFAHWLPIFTNTTPTNLLIYAEPKTAPEKFYRAVRQR